MKAPTSEISRLLESQIANTYSDEYTDESGRVLSIGDGIARVIWSPQDTGRRDG